MPSLPKSINSALIALSAIIALAGGCIAIPTPNPDYPAAAREIDHDWSRMRNDRKPLDRPVVVLGGYRAWEFTATGFASRLRSITSGDERDFLPIAYPLKTSFRPIASEVIDRVEAQWPSDDPAQTVEVDVVGISMGGLVARCAALPGGPSGNGKRLRIRRLYTVASPHRGASLAAMVTIDPAGRDMKPGSDFLATLDDALEDCGYELICYARLRDSWVGATNTAPPGMDPIWVRGLLFGSHPTVTHDRRIMADIARRLRSEPPLAARGSRPPHD